MALRQCERCGYKVPPGTPRSRTGNGQLLGPCCTKNQVIATRRIDVVEEARTKFGVAHTSQGRHLLFGKTSIAHDDQEQRLQHGVDWTPHPVHEPVNFAVDGARSYTKKVGIGHDPHGVDFHQVNTSPDTIRSLGRAYDALPHIDKAALPHFNSLRDEVNHQYHHLTHDIGVHVQSVEHDPYKHAGEMIDDVRNNKRLQVMATRVTGHHPFYSDEENDRFRAVHDFFGHAATGREFDAHGEEAAAHAHSRMFSAHAVPALMSETRGQNGSLILNGDFGPQKIAIMHHSLWTPNGPSKKDYQRMASLQPKVAHDSGDGETIYHCFSCGSGKVIARSDRSTECMYCGQVFTVQVQPQFAAFPQTVNGVPTPVPGMPGQIEGDDPNAPMDPDAMGDDGSFPPDEATDEAEENDGDESGSGDSGSGNPFAKGSSLKTRAGHLLDEDDFVRHLAIRHSVDPREMAGMVKAERAT